MRILFVGMPDSVHTARWINMISDQGWELYFFPVYTRSPHSLLKNITIIDGVILDQSEYFNRSVKILGFWPFLKWKAFIAAHMNWIDRKINFRKRLLLLVIIFLKPDIIHSIEFQKAGYITLYAKNKMKNSFPKWIATNYGSDIFLFSRLSDHKDKIISILKNCDYYDCECKRDVQLAKELGLKGKILPIIPNSGGFNLEEIEQLKQKIPPSKRKLIILKGYHGWAGRALIGLDSIEQVAECLINYRIAIINANDDVKIAAKVLTQQTGIQIDIIPKSAHENILKLFGNARIYIGLSISDAISTSLLEAMVMGAFPIQSDTSCADEWIENGISGFIVPPEDPGVIAEKISLALQDDKMVDQAFEMNHSTIKQRLDLKIIKPQVVQIYKDISNELLS